MGVCDRRSIRFITKELRVKVVDAPPNTNADNLAVMDVSLRGCAIEANESCNFKEGEKVKLTFHYTNSTTISLIDACVIYRKDEGGRTRIGFLFDEALRPESLGGFKSYFVTPLSDRQTQNSIYENQKVVAKNDLEALRRDVLHLKGCQFQLLLGSLPLFVAQGATTVPMFSLGVGESIPIWAILTPIVSAFLSYMMLIVFLQKTGAIRRNLSFVMLLQRHMVMGSFPPCYRGWQDAYENYNHMLRYGDKKKYEGSNRVTEKKAFNILPTDAFTWLGVAVLGAVPIISVVMLWGMLLVVKTDIGIYTFVVWGSTFLVTMLYIYVLLRIKSLLNGGQSFRNIVIVFSKILKNCPPFDPKNFEKI